MYSYYIRLTVNKCHTQTNFTYIYIIIYNPDTLLYVKYYMKRARFCAFFKMSFEILVFILHCTKDDSMSAFRDNCVYFSSWTKISQSVLLRKAAVD